MIAANYDDALSQIEAAGIVVDGGVLQVNTPKPVRCFIDGERKRKGWYWLQEMPFSNGDTMLVGSFGVWHGNDNGAQKIILPKGTKPSKEERALIAKRMAESRRRMAAMQKAKEQRAAKQALLKWSALAEDGESGYFRRKQVGAHGVRFTKDGAIAVPMRDAKGRLAGIQFILDKENPEHKEKIKRIDGDKRFWPSGLAMKSRHHTIGRINHAGVNIVTEGYATGASIHQATGLPVIVVFSANNILPAIEALAKQHPRAGWLIAADDDYLCRCQHCRKQTPVAIDEEIVPCRHCGEDHGKINTGITFAKQAALILNHVGWFAPQFVDRQGKKYTDFNDLHVLEGIEAVEAQVRDAVAEFAPVLGSPKASGAGGAPPKGGGDDALPTFITVDEAAERFVQVFDVKDTVFDRRLHCLLPKSAMIDIMPDHGWRDLKQHPYRQLVMMDQVGFDPGGDDPKVKCNLWGGWPTVPSAHGSCDKLLELLEYMCSEEENPRDVFKWVLRWLAYPIQHPGAKMKTALVFHGGQGVGKNIFFEVVMAIYGEYGRVVGQADIEDKFNDWVSRKLFLIANEVVARQELFHQKNKLKALITDDHIRVNPKNVAAHYERNHMNMVFLSNEAQPVVLEADDRRYMVVWTPPKREKAFYDAVVDEIRQGGIAALHQHLLDIDLGDFDHATIPLQTRARMQLIQVSKESPDRFVESWLGDELDVPMQACALHDLYQLYKRWCSAEGEPYAYSKNKFSARINARQDINVARKPVFRAASLPPRVTSVVLPLGDEKPEDESWMKWLDTRIKGFQDAMDGGL